MPFAHPVKRTLLLVAQPEYLATDDLFLIRDKIAGQAPDLTVLVVGRGDRAELLAASLWQRPVLTVSFGPMGSFRPLRGAVLFNRAVAKIEQFAKLAAAGIATPMTAVFRFGMPLERSVWGDLCVLKPADLSNTSSGRGLYLYRTARLERLTEEALPEAHHARLGPMLVQSFVDTGPHFRVYRCLTLFGEAIYQNLSEDPETHPPLEASDDVIETIHPEPHRARAAPRLDTDPEVMSFAGRIHTAFPDVPLLGCDIVREHATGRLFAIEVNAGGNVWHLSSPRTQAFRSISKIQDYLKTFQSYDKAALALIRAARRHAR
jgi:hypothetical protein